MPDSRTTAPVRVTSLQPHDTGVVRRWLADFLRQHQRAWVGVRGLGWSPGEVDAQLVATDLVGDHWQRIVRANARDDDLVQVARSRQRAVGIVWAAERVDDYLRVPEGVLNWVYVDPEARGQGIGGLLVGAAKAWMERRGLTSWSVAVQARNEAALRLYRSAGLADADLRLMGRLGPERET